MFLVFYERRMLPLESVAEDVVHIKCSSLSSDHTASPLRCDGGWSTRRLV